MSYGYVLKIVGFIVCVIEVYCWVLVIQLLFGEVWWSLVNFKMFCFLDDEVVIMCVQLGFMDMFDDDCLYLDFVFGKVLEDVGEYVVLFDYYVVGNVCCYVQLYYDLVEMYVWVEYICCQYMCEFFVVCVGSGSVVCDLIFIVGLLCFGFILIEQIFFSYSQVEGMMELFEVILIIWLLCEQVEGEGVMLYYEVLVWFDVDVLCELGECYLVYMCIYCKIVVLLFIDKMLNNFMYIGLIQLMLFNVIIIDVCWYLMVCCFFGFKQYFVCGQSFSYWLDDFVCYYMDYVWLMVYFDVVLFGCVYWVIYEWMVEDIEGEVWWLLVYCGLLFEEVCLCFFENECLVCIVSFEQVCWFIYCEGVDQWWYYVLWLGLLEEGLGEVLWMYFVVLV